MYKLNLTNETFETLSEAEEALFDWCEEHQDELIDEDNAEVEIYGMHYSPSMVLKELDPIAYNCLTSDFQNAFYDEIVEIEDEEDEEDEEEEA